MQGSELAGVMASGGTLEIGGVMYEFRPPTLRDLGLVDNECLRRRRRELIETYVANADLLPASIRDEKISDAFYRAERLDVDDLPTRKVEVAVLENGRPKYVDGELQTTVQEVPYSTWWGSQTFDGKLYLAWLSMRRAKPGLTLDEVDSLMTTAGYEALDQAAELVGKLASENPTEPPKEEDTAKAD